MKEALLIMNQKSFDAAVMELDETIQYQRKKLNSLESQLSEIIELFTKSFNTQTKDLIISHGEKFISVAATNPFAQKALEESVSVSKIEKSQKRLVELIDAFKKVR